MAPKPPHRTLDRKTQKHTSEYFGLYIVIRRYLHRYFEPYENNGLLIFFFTTKIIKTPEFFPEYQTFFPQREQNFINPPITNIPPLYKRIIIFRGRVCGHITPYQIRKGFPRIKDARKTWGAWCNATNTRRSLPP